MDKKPSKHTGLSTQNLNLRLDGVEEILSGWSGRGSLYSAMATIDSGVDPSRDWSEQAIRARATRILLEAVRPMLNLWPLTMDGWRPHLPITSRSEVETSSVPGGRVNWAETVRRFGWPPHSYVTRRRTREIADVTVTSLAWTIDQLDGLLTPTVRASLDSELVDEMSIPIEAARDALTLTDVPGSPPQPDRLDLRALQTAGWPWSLVEPVADSLIRAEIDPTWFAGELLAPDPEFRWRLFHLSALGHIVRALRKECVSVSWKAPMGASMSKGPNFVARLPNGEEIDVWFEAARARKYYGADQLSLYSQVVNSVSGADASIGADIGLFIPSRSHALLFECKFSGSPTYVGRNGYHQIAGYLLNAQDQWSRVWSYILGPEEHILSTNHISAPGTERSDVVGVSSIPKVSSLIADFVN